MDRGIDEALEALERLHLYRHTYGLREESAQEDADTIRAALERQSELQDIISRLNTLARSREAE